jgi:hypothetical protein
VNADTEKKIDAPLAQTTLEEKGIPAILCMARVPAGRPVADEEVMGRGQS